MAMLLDPRARRELLKSLQRFFQEYKRSKTGMFGLILLVLFVIVSVAYPYIGKPEIVENWITNPQYFYGLYPDKAPPCWVSKITGKTYTTRQVIGGDQVKQAAVWGNATVIDVFTGKEAQVPTYNYTLEFTFKIDGDVPTREITVIFSRIFYNSSFIVANIEGYLGQVENLYKAFLDAFKNEQLAFQLTVQNFCPQQAAQLKTLEDVAWCMYEKDFQKAVQSYHEELEKARQEGKPFNKTLIDYLVQKGVITVKPFMVSKLYLYRPDGVVLEMVTPDHPYSILEIVGTNPTAYNASDYRLVFINGVFKRRVEVETPNGTVKMPLIGAAVWRLYNITVDVTKADLDLLPFAQNITAVAEGRRDVPVLKGEYRLVMGFYGVNVTAADFRVGMAVVTGSCYGVLGTDDKGRDLWQGILYGVRWALIIGVLTSLLSVLLGAVYGVLSGYYGGLRDEIMLRIAQIIYSLPVLPLLILLSYVIRPSIWTLILILVAFSWPGVAFVTRSMALQIKESVYVEAAKALGASDRRITLLYVFPQILPYLFASIALSVPGAILAEAGLSFLGLGDPYTLTWGKILYEAQGASAVINGLWWWVVPPGLAIALVGMTFVFIGNAIDAILNPKLKR